jgi:alpha-amylase
MCASTHGRHFAKHLRKHLDRLKEMGVQTLWFMPINPISKVERKGTLGSYYAVSDYTAINPEYGTMDDWKALVKQAHEKGF